MGGVSEIESAPNRVQGTVFLADGTTPAFAAQALLFVPGQAQAVGEGVTDAAGRLTCRGRWITMDADARVPDGLVTKPTVVGAPTGRGRGDNHRLRVGQADPGGAPCADLSDGICDPRRPADRRTQCPRPGRRGVPGPGRARRRAGGRGVGAVRRPIVPPGLTPGRYLVQAARDGIWLSSAVELVAEGSKARTRDRPERPRARRAVALEVVDDDGRPLAGEMVRPVRPEGPLRSLWSAGLRTDADGFVTLWGLEAGRHEILIGDQPMRHEVRVSEASGAATRPVATRVILRRTDPARPGG